MPAALKFYDFIKKNIFIVLSFTFGDNYCRLRWKGPGMNASSRLSVVLAVLVFAVSQGYLAQLVHQLRPNILFLQLTFDPVRYWAILEAWGDEGERAYREHFAYDFFHLVIYAACGHIVATRSALFGPDACKLASITAWLLPLAAVFDFAENLLQLHLLAGPAGARSLLIPLSALCSTLKWGLAAGFAGVIGWRLARKWTQIGRVSR